MSKLTLRDLLIANGVLKPRPDDGAPTPMRPASAPVLRQDEIGRARAIRDVARWRAEGCPIRELEHIRATDPMHKTVKIVLRENLRRNAGGVNHDSPQK